MICWMLTSHMAFLGGVIVARVTVPGRCVARCGLDPAAYQQALGRKECIARRRPNLIL
jgi:hypothetical protein